MSTPEIDLPVYPDECDAFGHLNQASFLSLFERARWEMLARGPGMNVFDRAGVWPAVRKAAIDYHAGAFPGDVLRFQQALTHHGRTSFTMRQTARRVRDDALIATAEFVFVCINRAGRPVPVPHEVVTFMGGEPTESDVRRIVVNGVSLALDVAGSGPAVLFIHGYPLDRTLWRHQVEHLRGYRRIAPDLRGMGHSDAPDLGYSMGTYADDLGALLDALGVDEAVLCGISMGGYIALECVRRWRRRIRGLVLMDTRAEADSPEARKGRDAAASAAREGGAAAVADAMLPKLFAGESESAVGAAWKQVDTMIRGTQVPGIIGALSAMRDRMDSTPLLPALGDLPVLVVTGEADRIIPAGHARALAEAIPGAKLQIIGGAGHLPPVERPAETTDVLREFLEETYGPVHDRAG
ncbi:MAG TPA: alpha/beta fold hydrolase [Gemmatimonadales bacterium]|nr:alpha/beta fold hydrolase [Gemmatimonadales bacterium]